METSKSKNITPISGVDYLKKIVDDRGWLSPTDFAHAKQLEIQAINGLSIAALTNAINMIKNRIK